MADNRRRGVGFPPRSPDEPSARGRGRDLAREPVERFAVGLSLFRADRFDSALDKVRASSTVTS